MQATRRIVVGADGSPGSHLALRWAVCEAAHRGASVQVVAAWCRPRPDGSREAHTLPDGATAAAVLRTEAAATAGLADPMPSIAWLAMEGRAPRALTQTARDATLLVLGSHGHGRRYHSAVGSVTEECVRYAACPVVVVPLPHPERDAQPPNPPSLPDGHRVPEQI